MKMKHLTLNNMANNDVEGETMENDGNMNNNASDYNNDPSEYELIRERNIEERKR